MKFVLRWKLPDIRYWKNAIEENGRRSFPGGIDMHRFYADPVVSGSGKVYLSREDAFHAAKVLRLHSGDSVEIVISGVRHAGEVCEISDTNVTISVQEELPSTETRVRFVLLQGIPKGDKMELIVQKATELGVSDVVPVMMARSVVKIDPKDRIRKQERWQKIAREAGKQSGRCIIPEIHPPVTVRETEDIIRKLDAVAVPWEAGRDFGPLAFMKAHPDIGSLGIFIGPEGGIEPEEISLLTSFSCDIITLGPRIMRTETAGLAAVSAFSALYGEME